MDRPCYEKTLIGYAGEIALLEQVIEWLRKQERIFVKEILYQPGEQDCIHIIYEGFPDTDSVMMKYWEQESGRRHPKREDIK